MSKRKEILVIKIVDFRDDKDEPAFDVELYENGKIVMSCFGEKSDGIFSTEKYSDKIALKLAREYAHRCIANLELQEAEERGEVK